MGAEPSREAVLEAERRGELLMAFDLAERGLAERPDDVWLKHRAVLALARAGATAEAARRFGEYGLADVRDEDVSALEARIAKDVALAAPTPEGRQRGAAHAADLYEQTFERTGGYYPAINAATMRLIAGDKEAAGALAAAALETADMSYYGLATVAEAQLVRGDVD